MRRILIVCTVLAAAGCANQAPTFDDLTPPQRQKLLSMQYSTDRPDRPFTVLGPVDGAACGSSSAQTSEDLQNKAMEGAMVKAVLLGADGVTGTFCRSGADRDLLDLCNAPMKCYGQAIKFTDGSAPVEPAAPLPVEQPMPQTPPPPVEPQPVQPPAEPAPEANPSQ
jgi:hypothetical protein